jgi:hypothetical protein
MYNNEEKYNFEYSQPSSNNLTWKESLFIFGIIIGSNIIILLIFLYAINVL